MGIDMQNIFIITRSRVYTNRSRAGLGCVASMLKRVPGALQKETLLRVHNFGLARPIPKERCIKKINILQNNTRLHIPRLSQDLRSNASLKQFLVCKKCDALSAGAQQLPEGLNI